MIATCYIYQLTGAVFSIPYRDLSAPVSKTGMKIYEIRVDLTMMAHIIEIIHKK